MKYMITGISGFVGDYLVRHIIGQEKDAEIIGLDVSGAKNDYGPGSRFYQINLLERESVDRIIHDIKPDAIIHLASFSSVSYSWKNPVESFKNNMNIFLNILESVNSGGVKCKILSIGSSEEYGIVTEKDLPLVESMKIFPASPYAVARVAQEQMSVVFAKGFGLDVVCTRSFNHIGAGQSDQFVVSSICRKFVEIKKGLTDKLMVGNTGVIRDFLDVRDVVRAYYSLVKQGQKGEIYNICGGRGYSIKDVIQLFQDITGIRPVIETDPALLRPVENAVVVGSYEKIKKAFGWEPRFNIESTLREMLKYWEGRLEGGK